ETQVGKIVTAYPENDDEAVSLARRLDRIWPSTAGPVVPSDLRLRDESAVYLRYGTFGGGDVFVDSSGLYEYRLRHPDGSLISESRNLLGLQPDWAPKLEVPIVHSTIPDLMQIVTVEQSEYLPLALLY